jgi:TRAP-type C4-dicarboxylate transport system substrate-binding protein
MKTTYFKTSFFVLIACILASTSLAQTRLVLYHTGYPGSLYEIAGEYFSQEVRRVSRGRIQVKLSRGFSSGSAERLIRQGGLLLSGSFLDTMVPEFEVFSLPYLIKNREHMQRIDKEIIKPYLSEKAKSRGLILLGVWEYGFLQIANRRGPIRDYYDFKGLKLSTYNNNWHVKTFEYLRALPVSMPMPELYPAMKMGVIDGAELTLTLIDKMGLYEVNPYLSITNHAYFPAFLIMDQGRHRSLNRGDQEILNRAAENTQRYIFDVAREKDEKARRDLERKGVRINEVNSNEISYRVKGVYDEFARNIRGGSGLISKILKLK